MTEFSEEGELVEGAKCHVVTRWNEWKGLKKDPITNKICTLYELDRNCSVNITESIRFNSKDEQKLRELKNVHNNIGDQIKGKSIQLYVDSKRNCLKFPSKEGVSHRHGAQIEDTKTRTVGKLKYTIKCFRKFLEKSKNNRLENKI